MATYEIRRRDSLRNDLGESCQEVITMTFSFRQPFGVWEGQMNSFECQNEGLGHNSSPIFIQSPSWNS